MSRIIDADNTVKTICGYYCGCERDECCSDDPCEAVAFIDAAPTISPDEARGVGKINAILRDENDKLKQASVAWFLRAFKEG